MADLKLTADFTDLQTLKRELLDIPKKARDSARTFEAEFARAERILVKQARQFQKNAQESQKFYSELLKLNSATKDAERSAQVFVRELEKEERAAAKAKTNYERLRATFDSSYAARMRLRQASQTLRAAVDAEIISVQEAAAMLRQYNSAAGAAADDLARRLNRQGVITQQAGYQLGDFIVQVQSGTNWMVAFGQQATQVAGTLTLLGGKWILIGSVLGVAIPLITAVGAAFLRTRNQAEEATESYEGLAQTLTKLEQIRLNSVGKSLADGAKEAIKEWENLLALMERVELRSLENELKKEFDNIIDQLSAFQNRLDVAARLGNAAPEFALFDLKNMEEGIRLAQIVRGIQGESRQELQEQLRIAEERLRNEGLLTDATEELINNLANALGLTESLSDKTNEAADAAERFANNLVLGQEYLANAVRAGVASGAIPPQALNSLPQTAGEKAYQDLMERRRREYYANQDKESRGRGGGGRSGTPEFVSRVFGPELQKAIEQAQEDLRLYNQEVQMLDSALQAGLVTQQEYNSFVAQAREAYNQAQQGAYDYASAMEQVESTAMRSMEGAFMSLIDGSKSASDAFRDMAREILSEAMRMLVIRPMIESLFGGGLGGGSGIFSIFGKNASGGTMMAGKPYLVGEHGPELVIPGRSGTVMNADLTNKAMGGGQAVVINQTFQFSANGDDSVKRIIAAEAPKIAALTQKQIVDQRRRGGQMRSVFG